MEQTLSDPNDSEVEWLAKLLEIADVLRLDSISEVSSFFDSEQRSSSPSGLDPNTVINVVGAKVGELLARELDLRWQVVTDDFGTELGVVGEPNSIVICPMSSVGQRWKSSAPGEIQRFVTSALSSVREIRGRSAG
ncbi:hypothetical protein HDC94_001304 [Leifsonia sp. AK011]|uniref:DUF3806 domain-containing protein n=1 Tax=Leifsonia sp. AK011 TaxID=2723075 RepID=UPI0015CE12AF|nr:DUF3806 domain-containing protein [Leifsonia sp. AK011]NYF10148.1 hypothetical protein [Leifsonia sp. AK011]